VSQQLDYANMKNVYVNKYGQLVMDGWYAGNSEYYKFSIVWSLIKKDGDLYIRIQIEQCVHDLLEDLLEINVIPQLLEKAELNTKFVVPSKLYYCNYSIYQ